MTRALDSPGEDVRWIRATVGRRARYVSVSINDHPNMVLATTRFSCHKATPGRVLHVVERMGTPLLHVIEVEPPRAARAGS